MPMQESVEILRLTPADAAVLENLNRVFGRAFAEPVTYGANPPSRAYLESLLAKEHVIVLVARMRREVVGGLVAYEFEKFEQARREVYIYDLAVAERHRRCGIATSLIRRERIQIVHGHHGRDLWPTVLAARLSGVRPKVVLTRHLAKSPSSWFSRRFLLGG